jgi:DNA polymerase-3 subunit epsilon
MGNLNFVAVDFETATNTQMACQVGIAVVKNGEIVENFMRYIQPPGNYYDKNTYHGHHVRPEMTADAPTFDQLWPEIRQYFIGTTVVAHSNTHFDETVLKKNMDYYSIFEMGINKFIDTCSMFGGLSLENLCVGFRLPFSEEQHHNSDFDARCCAIFYMKHEQNEKPDLDLIREHPSSDRHRLNFEGHDRLCGDVLKKDLTGADPCNPFYDRKIVITGVFPIDRRLIARQLKSMGADVDGSVSKNINFILTGEEPGWEKMKKVEKLNLDGFNIRRLSYQDYVNIVAGDWDSYITDKEIKKDLDLTMAHYNLHHVTFTGFENAIYGKVLFFGGHLRGNDLDLRQIIGNLGAMSSCELSSEVNICLLSDATLSNLRLGVKDDTITYIQDYYNNNKSITFDFDFMSEQDVLDWCKMRCLHFGDRVTMQLYDDYIKSV